MNGEKVLTFTLTLYQFIDNVHGCRNYFFIDSHYSLPGIRF